MFIEDLNINLKHLSLKKWHLFLLSAELFFGQQNYCFWSAKLMFLISKFNPWSELFFDLQNYCC